MNPVLAEIMCLSILIGFLFAVAMAGIAIHLTRDPELLKNAEHCVEEDMLTDWNEFLAGIRNAWNSLVVKIKKMRPC